MCKFFSFCTDPVNHPGKRFYFDWKYRKENLIVDDADSHDHIISYHNLHDSYVNKYEYNPLTKVFVIDNINSEINDSVQSEEWAEQLDWKRIVEPLIVKPIVNPFDLPKQDVTPEIIDLLQQWIIVWDSVWDSIRASVRASVWASVGDSVGASVWASVGDSVWASVWASIRDSVWDSVGDSVWASIRDSVWDSVWASVWVYTGSFFDIKYNVDITPIIKLWEIGIIPSFDGATWILHSGKDADVIYEYKVKNEKGK